MWHYPGIWESVRPVSGWKSTINLDCKYSFELGVTSMQWLFFQVANSGFVKSGSVLQFLDEMTNGEVRPLKPFEIKNLETLVKGMCFRKRVIRPLA